MPVNNYESFAFDPNILEPIGQPRTIAGMTTGDSGAAPAYRTTPMRAANGTVFEKVETLDPNTGQPTGQHFMTTGPEGQKIKISQTGDGAWQAGEWKKEGFWKTVTGDKNLMTFLSVVALGAGAAAYAGAGAAGTTGTGAAAAAPVATATPVSMGTVAATPGLAGVTPAAAAAAGLGGTGGLVGGGSSAAAEEMMASEAAGAAGQGTSSIPVSQIPGGNETGSSWWQSLLGNRQVLGGLISGVGQGVGAYLSAENAAKLQQNEFDFRSGEAQKEREWKARNFGADKAPIINWKT